ncbi:MAG: hypothetical protein IH984_17200 [Planctomycetes bacterium]|nr:hypothetical protein [Planctomycetota bacterium]
MTSSDNQQTQALLDAYLDGEMEQKQREEFQKILAEDENLRAELELQQKIDDGLGRLFTPTSKDNVAEILGDSKMNLPHDAKASTKGSGIFTVRRFAAAAAIAGGIFGSWLTFNALKPTSINRLQWQSIEAVYAQAQANQVEVWLCEDEAEFADVFKNGYDQPLVLPFDTPQGIEVVGLAYRFTISRYTICLLSTVNDEPVLVLIDRVEAGARPSLSQKSALRLFEKRVGKLVLYEVTPWQEPSLLDLFYDPSRESDKKEPKVQENGS